jgi:DNA sulfur modification protein DndC
MVEDIAAEVRRIVDLIKEIYLSDSMPWIIGYSGGKDSTTCVQLVWMALQELTVEQRKKPVHIISTDTLVENPIVANWVTESLRKMEREAIKAALPIYPHRLVPELKNRFWVNLIGKGYPSPRPKFRWCTERLKIATATNFMQNLSETNGEAILVLGTRKAESAARAKTIEKYSQSSREYLSRNGDPKLSRVWVFAPISDWENDDVWEFIGTYENPWGVSSDDLLELYRGATPDRECPVVVDTSTQSCGDSRFGCFVCTMVSQDKSMQAMILNDDSKAWMKPILDFRDRYLAPNDKERENRDFKRLGNNNRLILLRDQLVHGPYTQKYRVELLRKLLEAQVKVKKDAPDGGFKEVDLISREELEEIRRIWLEEKGELEDYVPQIYEEVMGVPYFGHAVIDSPFEQADLDLLKQTCREWVGSNMPADDAALSEERAKEAYELTRALLAAGIRSGENKRRSKQLDCVGAILQKCAFTDEAQATEFARKSSQEGEAAEDSPKEAESADSSDEVLPLEQQQFLY